MCIKARFILVQRHSKYSTQLPSGIGPYVTLCYRHGLLYKNRKTMNIRDTNTRLGYSKDDLCQLQVNNLLCTPTNHCMLPKSSTNRKYYSLEYSGHI